MPDVEGVVEIQRSWQKLSMLSRSYLFGLKILGIGGAHFGRHDVPYWYRGDEGRTFSWELGSPDIAFVSASGGNRAVRQVEAATERHTPAD